MLAVACAALNRCRRRHAAARAAAPALPATHARLCIMCVRRAENSYTHRHLCEFTGLDFEMAIFEHYFEVGPRFERARMRLKLKS